MRALVFGVELERGVVVVKRLCQIGGRTLAVGVAQQIVHIRIAWLFPNCLVQLEHRFAPVFGIDRLAGVGQPFTHGRAGWRISGQGVLGCRNKRRQRDGQRHGFDAVRQDWHCHEGLL